jgi:hypothetical protein
MYADSIEYLFDHVPVGTSVTTVMQPVKFAWIGKMLYIEAHPDEMLADQVERVGGAPLDYKVPADIFSNLSRAAGKARDDIDWQAVRDALRERRGYPVPILKGYTDDDMFVSPAVIERAGTARMEPRLTSEPTDAPPGAVKAVDQVPPSDGDAPVRHRMGGFNG